MTSPLLRVTTRALIVPLVLLGVYLLWRGHNEPGGGFIAALVFGVALALRALTDPTEGPLRFPPAGVLLGAGMMLALSAVVAPLLVGDALLTSYEAHVYPFGFDVHLSSSLVFDSGVALIVVGLLRGVIDALEHPDVGGTDDEDEPVDAGLGVRP
jgi:multicomponent Na+:H+ antiporter subunit A